MKLELPFQSNAEWMAVLTLTRLSGILSFSGSLTILYIILTDRANKWKKIHYRLLTGVSFFDLLSSGSMIVSSAAIPKDTEEIYNIHGNIGNVATCKAQGFFLQLGMLGTPLYLVSLSLYYLLVVRYNLKDDFIRRRVEPCMHILSVSIPLATAITALCLDLYNQKLVVCWIEAKPWGCTVDKSIPCTNGKHAPWYEIFFAGIWVAFAFCFETVCMGLIYRTVRKREVIMNAFSLRGRNGQILSSSSSRITVERRDTAVQAILFISAFIFTYTWPFISFSMYHVADHGPKVAIALLATFFGPLLGFWNFVAFIRPRFVKLTRENRNSTFLGKMKTIITSKTLIVPQRMTTRRRSSGASVSSTISAFYIACTHSWTRFVTTIRHGEHMDDAAHGSVPGINECLTFECSNSQSMES